MVKRSVLRWGILGAARVNERLLPAILAAENAQLMAIASRRKGAASDLVAKYAPQKKNKIHCLDDPDALLNDPDIDAIYLPMANHEHTEWALKAITAGKHVLIEKPMALTVGDIDAITQAATIHDVNVMEGFMYVFHPQHDYVGKIIAAGNIGDVRTVKTCFSFPMKPARLYRLEKAVTQGGGAMWDIGPYAIHSARKWFDSAPVSVVAMAKFIDSGADTSLSGVLDFDDGKYAHFDISFERARCSEYEIIGTLGGVRCHTVWQNPKDSPVVTWWTDSGEYHRVELMAKVNHFELEIAHFSDCVLNRKTPALTLADAKTNCQTILAALQSASTAASVVINHSVT